MGQTKRLYETRNKMPTSRVVGKDRDRDGGRCRVQGAGCRVNKIPTKHCTFACIIATKLKRNVQPDKWRRVGSGE